MFAVCAMLKAERQRGIMATKCKCPNIGNYDRAEKGELILIAPGADLKRPESVPTWSP